MRLQWNFLAHGVGYRLARRGTEQARAGERVVELAHAQRVLRRWLADSSQRHTVAAAIVGAVSPTSRGAIDDPRLYRAFERAWVLYQRDLPAIGLPEKATLETVGETTRTQPKVKLTWIEIELVNELGDPVPGERYRVDFEDDTPPREGRLDARGLAFVDRIPAGRCVVSFPDHDKDAISKKGTSPKPLSRAAPE